jgi:hypothetical protein
LEGSSPRESGAAVEYENGVYGVQYQLGDNPDKDRPGYSDYWQQKVYEDNIVATRVGDPIKLCLVSIPLHYPKGDGRGREYTALDLRNHRWWLSRSSIVEFEGRPVKSVRKAFARAAKDAGLSGGNPHVPQHAAVTWAMQAGADPCAAADFFGMTLEVLERV